MTIITTKQDFIKFVQNWKTITRDGTQLTAADYMLYNIIRNKHQYSGFTPITNQTKLKNGHHINYMAWMSSCELIRNIQEIAYWLDADRQLKTGVCAQEQVTVHSFWKKYSKVLTAEQISSIVCEQTKLTGYHNAVKHICDNNIKKITYIDLEVIKQTGTLA